MRTPALLLSSLILCTALSAQQRPTFTTATDFGVLAIEGSYDDFDAKAASTSYRYGFQIQAEIGNDCNSAEARTSVASVSSSRCGYGVRVRESGAVDLRDSNRTTAGTSGSAPGVHQPSFGAHGLEVVYAVPRGTRGFVQIYFSGDATNHASGRAAFDVDGDGQPDFAAQASGESHEVSLPVTAGRNGVIIGIATEGQAERQSRGQAGYEFQLYVFFCAGAMTPNVGITRFHGDCGLHLAARYVEDPTTGSSLCLDFTGGQPYARGAVIIANRMASAIPLPFSQCDLLLDPLGQIGHIQLNRCGEEHICIPFLLHPTLISFQALQFNTCGGQFTIDASNGVELSIW